MKLLLLGVYFLVVIIIGIYSSKSIKTNKDFFIAGKQAGVFQVAGSLLASVLGSSAILGSVNFAYSSGWAGAWLLVCASLGMALLYPLINRIKDFNGYNLPSMLGHFYGTEVQRISSLIIPIAWLGVIASQIIGAANIVNILTGISYEKGVILSGAVFIFYTIMGGQLSILKTDFVQLIFILVGVVITFFFVSSESITREVLPLVNYKFSYMDIFVMVLTYSTTFIVGPDIYSRLFCARDEKVMKHSVIITVVVLLPLAYMLTRIGIYGIELFGGKSLGSSSVLLLIADGYIPKFAAIILYFALLSAVISSADTTLLTASSLFTQVFIRDLNNKKAIFITRILIVVFGVLAILVAIKMKYILTTLLSALAIYSGSFIIPTFVGMFGFRVKEKVVILAIILGGIISLVGKKYGGDVGNLISISAFLVNGLTLYVGKKLEGRN